MTRKLVTADLPGGDRGGGNKLPVVLAVLVVVLAILSIYLYWQQTNPSSDQTTQTPQTGVFSIGTAYATGPSGDIWTVVIGGSNTGPAGATITQVQADDMPFAGIVNVTLPLSVPSGASFTLQLTLPSTAYASGQTMVVKLVTTQSSYSQVVVFP